MLFIIDILELIYLLLSSNKVEDYDAVGFSEYFLKFRLLGGIIGIIVLLIFYILSIISKSYENLAIYYFAPFMILSEIVLLAICIYYLNQEKIKEKIISKDKSKNKSNMKKWYCIILGFNHGLVEVIISFVMICSCLVCLLFYIFNKYTCCCSEFTWEYTKNILQCFTFSS